MEEKNNKMVHILTKICIQDGVTYALWMQALRQVRREPKCSLTPSAADTFDRQGGLLLLLLLLLLFLFLLFWKLYEIPQEIYHAISRGISKVMYVWFVGGIFF